MIWWLPFEKKSFQFWREIWIQVIVILSYYSCAHSIFQAVTVRPLSSAWTEWSILNSRRASPNVVKNRRWQMYILRNGCEPGKSKRICDPTGISPNFLTLHSFSWKRQHCVLSFYWADTGFKVYRLNRFGLNSYILSTSCHVRSDFKWILTIGS